VDRVVVPEVVVVIMLVEQEQQTKVMVVAQLRQTALMLLVVEVVPVLRPLLPLPVPVHQEVMVFNHLFQAQQHIMLVVVEEEQHSMRRLQVD
jgi:hypothetical protein